MEFDEQRPLRVMTLFSGYDSQMLALRRLMADNPGFKAELVAWCEIDRNACKAHDILFPEYAGLNLGDICKVDWSKAPQCDLATWSFPCQAISNAGLQKGLKEGSGTTSSLAYEAIKGFAVLRPKYLLMENVAALLQDKFKADWYDVRRRLEALGYKNFFQVLNAKDYGVPQNRERVFMVSVLRAACQGEPRYEFPEPFPLERRLKHVLEPAGTVPEEYYLKPHQVEKIVEHCDRKVAEGCGFKANFSDGEGVSGTVMARYGGRETDTRVKEGALFAGDEPGATAIKTVSAAYQDCTYDYEVATTCATLGEFLNSIIGQSYGGYKYYGNIDIKQGFSIKGSIICQCRYDEHGYKLSDDIDLNSKIVAITDARGGYGRLDFMVEISPDGGDGGDGEEDGPEPAMLTRQRTEAEKARRREHGDAGAKFSAAKEYAMRTDGSADALTTCSPGKEGLLAEPEIRQVGNIAKPRKNFADPEEGRVYAPEGISPAMKAQGEPKLIIVGNARPKKDPNCAIPLSTRGWIYDPRGIGPSLAATDYKDPRLVREDGAS